MSVVRKVHSCKLCNCDVSDINTGIFKSLHIYLSDTVPICVDLPDSCNTFSETKTLRGNYI